MGCRLTCPAPAAAAPATEGKGPWPPGAVATCVALGDSCAWDRPCWTAQGAGRFVGKADDAPWPVHPLPGHGRTPFALVHLPGWSPAGLPLVPLPVPSLVCPVPPAPQTLGVQAWVLAWCQTGVLHGGTTGSKEERVASSDRLPPTHAAGRPAFWSPRWLEPCKARGGVRVGMSGLWTASPGTVGSRGLGPVWVRPAGIHRVVVPGAATEGGTGTGASSSCPAGTGAHPKAGDCLLPRTTSQDPRNSSLLLRAHGRALGVFRKSVLVAGLFLF